MRIGYLMNTYPVISGTFIRREIHSIEAEGVEVLRYALRPWEGKLLDPADKVEKERTFYLLSRRVPALLADFAIECVTNPRRMWRALKGWARLWRNANGGFVPHVAYLLEAASLKRRAARDGIIHIHAHFSTNTAAVALLSRRMGGPGYSFTTHGPDEFVDWGPSSLAMKVSEALFVAAISNFARVQLALAAGMEHWNKLHVVRCGVSLDDYPLSDAPFGLDSPFVCVGRLCPQKAQSLIVDALAQVVQSHPDVQLRLIGDGDTRLEIETSVAQHGLENNVTLLGWRTNAEVREELGRARALVLPSFAEGLPVVIMEAFALGRPAISTFIAGIPELVDESCGWIIPAGSVDHIAAAMRAALDADTDTLKIKGAEGRTRVERQHDIAKEARKLLSHIYSIHRMSDESCK